MLVAESITEPVTVPFVCALTCNPHRVSTVKNSIFLICVFALCTISLHEVTIVTGLKQKQSNNYVTPPFSGISDNDINDSTSYDDDPFRCFAVDRSLIIFIVLSVFLNLRIVHIQRELNFCSNLPIDRYRVFKLIFDQVLRVEGRITSKAQ